MATRLLLLSHHQPSADAVKECLASSEFTVVQAPRVAQGIAALEAGEPFDVVALDVSPYNGDGARFVNLWRSDSLPSPKPSLIILTFDPGEWLVPGRGAAIVRKPVRLAELLAAIDRCVGGDQNRAV